MQSYIYMTTNLLNNKRYIGRKTSTRFIKDYFGSGNHIQNALKKYGKNNFSVKLIWICETKEASIEAEMFWIKYYNAVDDYNFYNHSPGGYHEGWVPGEANVAKTTYCRKINSQKHKGKTYSKETIDKRNKTYKKRFNEGLYNIGHPMSEKFKQEQSKRAKNYNLTKKDYNIISEKAQGKKMMYKDNIQTWVMKDEINSYLEDDWKIGSCKKRNITKPAWNKGLKGKQKAHNSNKIAINNGNITKYIYKKELDKYIKEGYSKGMKPRK